MVEKEDDELIQINKEINDELNQINKKIKRVNRRSWGFSKGLIRKKRYVYYLIFALSIILISFSLFYSIVNANFNHIIEGIELRLDNSLWEKIFYIGLSLLAVSFIFYDRYEANRDWARIKIMELLMNEYGHLITQKTHKEKVSTITQMSIRALDKIEKQGELVSLDFLRNSKDEDIKYLYENVWKKKLKEKGHDESLL